METESIPKVELHCHLIGVIHRALLKRVQEFGIQPLIEPNSVLPPDQVIGPAGFARWLESVGLYRQASWRDYLPILQIHMDDLRAQAVSYAEIMISPVMFPRDRDAALSELAEFVELTRAFGGSDLKIVYLFVIPRMITDAMIAHDTPLFVEARAAGLIAGTGVVGLDYEHDLDRLYPMLRTLKDAGLGIEVHSGEHTGADEVDAVLDWGLADRLGHGIRAFEDAQVAARIARDGVHVELCPTSNLRTGALASLADLPVREALDQGIGFSINTDDPGAFGCTLSGELAMVAEAFDLDTAGCEAIYKASIISAFDPPP